MTVFNSKEFSWSNLSIYAGGKLITGARGVKYKVMRDKEALHGVGSTPHSIQSGLKTYEGELVLLQSELESLNQSVKTQGYNDITDIALDIVVAYTPMGALSGAISTDKITGVEFTEFEKGMSTEDKFMEITLPFLALGVEQKK